MGTRRLAALLALLAVALGVLLAPAGPAAAHAVVVATDPQQRSVIGSSPTAVTVTFSEPVTPVPGRVQVIAPDGKRISIDEPTVRGNTLHIPVRTADQPLGTYLVSFRVISADSHPVAGGFTFSVGAPSASEPTVPDDDAHPSVAVAVPAAKYVGYLGLVLLVGPVLLLGLLWPRRLDRTVPARLAYAGVLLIGVGTLAGLWLQAPYRSGAAVLDVTVAEVTSALGSDTGAVLLARLGVLAAVTALLPTVLAGRAGRGRAGLLVALGLAGLVTWPLSGHPVAAPQPAVSVAADLVHLAAMAVWLGGLVVLVAVVLPRAHPRTLAVLLPAWSRWATIAVLWLVGAGVLQAVVEVGAWRSLVDSDYGRLVLAKAALLGVTLAVAAYARRLIHRRGTGLPVHRVRAGVAVELAALVVVLGLSATLVQTTPARTAQAPEAVAPGGLARTLTSPLYTLQFEIYPVELGPYNTVHAYLYTPDGRPLPAEEWSLTAALPDRGIEPVSTPLLGFLESHAIGSVAFPVPGDWLLRFTVRVSDVDQASVETTVSVG